MTIAHSLVECFFLIPIVRDRLLSDGEPHSSTCFDWLRNELFVAFGGATIAPGRFQGFYADPDTGELVADESVGYLVAVAEDHIDELRTLLQQACLVFKQKCIYLRVGVTVESVSPPES